METESIMIRYIENIVRGINKENERLKKSVLDFYEKLLIPVKELIVPDDLLEETKERLQCCFKDIYWSLKVHVLFYRRIDTKLTKTEEKKSGIKRKSPEITDDLIDETLKNVGYLGGLTDEQMVVTDAQIKDLPNGDLFEKLIDPGSKLLEMFRFVAASPKGEKIIQTGSKDHANQVLEMARSFLRTLHDNNTFLPKVLARVSREENSFIGASIAVSHFLRPIYLYSRVINRKKSLGEAIMKFRALNIFDEQNWEFEAFVRKNVQIQENEDEKGEEKGKKSSDEQNKSSVSQKRTTKQHIGPRDLCQNCKMIFRGDKSGKGGPSFLGACAEYCPVDELLPNESKLKDLLKSCEDPVINFLLTRNLSRCSLLFNEFESIYKRCKRAVDSKNDKLTEAIYWEVIYKLHIFGLKPECNPYF